MNCFILTPILLVVWGSLAWRYQTVVPYRDSLIPVLGEEISPLPGWLDKLQHIMLDSYLLCCGYLLLLSIKCNIIIYPKICHQNSKKLENEYNGKNIFLKTCKRFFQKECFLKPFYIMFGVMKNSFLFI